MRLLTFHLQGKAAHFRRYHSNSSALTYSIPPRTTIIGMIAGLLGFERDSHYELFSLDKCNITVAIKSPIKKLVQKMNLLKIEGINDFNGSKGVHTQTPTEIIFPQNLRNGYIDYQVWFYHKDKSIMEDFRKLIAGGNDFYITKGISLSLGGAQYLGWLRYEGEIEGEEKNYEASIPISSVIPIKYINDIEIGRDSYNKYFFVKEDIPLEFDKDRRLTETGKGNMLINLFSHPIKATVTKYVELSNNEYITWME
ncbi:CRISPR-associated protein Cas5 [Thermoanaerobacter thermohydrosulfuricus]